jgi:hypothetical protein
VPIVGEGTVSRSVSYEATAGREEEPAYPDRMWLKDSVTIKEPLAGTYDADGQATVSGTYTDHLAITLKRLKL